MIGSIYEAWSRCKSYRVYNPVADKERYLANMSRLARLANKQR